MKGKLGVGIPYYESDLGKREILKDCVNSFTGHYDELLVLSGKQPTLARAINILMAKLAQDNEYIIICNDDVILDGGSLRDLCDPNHVVSPYVNGMQSKLFHSHLFCIPTKLYHKVGKQFEGYDGFYYDDSDYWMKIEAKGIEIITNKRVNIIHKHPGRTLGTYPGNDKRMEHNKRIFLDRWGQDNLNKIQ